MLINEPVFVNSTTIIKLHEWFIIFMKSLVLNLLVSKEVKLGVSCIIYLFKNTCTELIETELFAITIK